MKWEPSAPFLGSIFPLIFLGAALYIFVLFTQTPEQWFRIIGPVMLSLVASLAWFFHTRGQTAVTLRVLALGTWVTITGVAVMNGSIKIPLAYAYPLVILMTGWLISVRAAIFMAALTSLASLLLVLAETQNSLYQPPAPSILLFGVAQVIVSITAGAIIVFMVNAYKKRLSELNTIGMQFAQRSHDLDQIRVELQQAQEVAKVGSWIYELPRDHMRLSDETCRMFGVPPGTCGSMQTYLSFTLEEDRDALLVAWQAALQGATFDHSHRIKVGRSNRWVRQKATMELGPDGAVVRAVGISQDITDTKLADISLRQSEKRFSTVFRSSPVASTISVASTDLILEVNGNFERDFGWTHAEMVGKTAIEVGYWPSRQARDTLRDLIHRQGRVVGYEAEGFRKNGEVCCFSVSGELIEVDGQLCLLAFIADITQQKKTEAQIQLFAFYDPLTQLPNRRLLMNRLEQVLAASSRDQRQSALLFIDLDNFKTLNDTHGHDKGDALLCQVAQRLLACVRDGDTVARFGGDEFVLMLKDLSHNALEAASQAERAAEKIRVDLNLNYHLGDISHHSSPSIGVTLFGGEPESIEEPLKRADMAMYQAKAAGRNTIRFFDPQMQAVVSARAGLETELREALRLGQFVLHYQPQVKGECEVFGAEALVRWQHPERGVVPPAEFIALAEDAGLILPLGAWVLETVCAQLAAWADRPALAQLTLAVNVSARQFHQPGFVLQVQQALERTGANPARLKLELTESLLVSNVEDLIAKMKVLQTQGVGFSLDDFGTGYSSLSYLKRLPLDQLKIDQSFVRDILVDPNDAAIAKMVIVLAASLGLQVIAEGVESQEQKDALAAHGCHVFQGYFFSRPLPIEMFEAYLSRQLDS